MDKFALIMVLHSHQPVGNFPHVFAQAVERCYRPVVEILSRYPAFRCGLHFSGPLVSWLEENDPGLLEVVAQMVRRGQVEVLSGGYYEPLLAAIPRADAVAQLERMNAWVQRRFGRDPTGFWLAERIWEPEMPARLAGTGMRYTLVDDTHFYYAGLGPDDMFGYRLTEREGHTLALLPSHKTLRYTIPFQEPSQTLDFLRGAFERLGPLCATYGDDSEKFGLWPGTHEWVLEKGWLVRFIEAVLEAGDWLETVPPGEYIARHAPRGRVYLPTASYEEMLTWALPAEAAQELEAIVAELKAEGRYERLRRFLRGGMWDNFLVKYRESNLMHKRMLFTSARLHAARASREAFDHLHQAQCNCAYWHGLFGGLYLGHLRQAVHHHLCSALTICDHEQRGSGPWAYCHQEDLDRDGHTELLLANSSLDALVHPAYGGSVSQLYLRGPRFNLADCLTRRREAYHLHLAQQPPAQSQDEGVASIHDRVAFKEKGLDEHLIYDWYHRGMFQDHLLPPEATLAAFRRAAYPEWGDLVDQPYRVLELGAEGDRAWCRLERQGHLWAPEGPVRLRVVKTYTLGPGGRLRVDYRLEPGEGELPGGVRLGVELNFTLLSAQDPSRRVETAAGEVLPLDRAVEAGPVEGLVLVSETEGLRVEVGLSRPAAVWLWPVETVSQSEEGLERTYQGSSLTLLWELPGPGEWAVELRVE